jgi:small GTP-binding protein
MKKLVMSQNVLILGDSGVGKTNIINRLINKPFNRVFVPSEFTLQTIIPDTDITIYDYPGELKFHPVFPIGITKVIIVYDMTNRMSYKNLEWWREKANVEYSVPIFVVGNKMDNNNCKILEGDIISAKDNINLHLLIDFILS